MKDDCGTDVGFLVCPCGYLITQQDHDRVPVWSRIALLLAAVTLFGSILFGCQRGPRIVPVRGTVTLDGNPLEFGTVTFQPQVGPAAKGTIQADGTFVLSTSHAGDGAVVGSHYVKIACYESQAPRTNDGGTTAGERSLGKLLIPQRYTLFEASGLTAEVTSGGENNFSFKLTSQE